MWGELGSSWQLCIATCALHAQRSTDRRNAWGSGMMLDYRGSLNFCCLGRFQWRGGLTCPHPRLSRVSTNENAAGRIGRQIRHYRTRRMTTNDYRVQTIVALATRHILISILLRPPLPSGQPPTLAVAPGCGRAEASSNFHFNFHPISTRLMPAIAPRTMMCLVCVSF